MKLKILNILKHACIYRVQHLRGVAASLGLVFNTDRKTFASTLMGHTLLEYAKQVDGGIKQDDVAEKLFKVLYLLR
jgi:predicted DsbA family dithiol-disulfide isomerase